MNAMIIATIDTRFSAEAKAHGQKCTDRGYPLRQFRGATEAGLGYVAGH